MRKPGEELPMGPGYLGIKTLLSLGFPLSGVHYPQQPTHTPPSLSGQQNLVLPRQTGIDNPTPSPSVGLQDGVVCQIFGYSTLFSS